MQTVPLMYFHPCFPLHCDASDILYSYFSTPASPPLPSTHNQQQTFQHKATGNKKKQISGYFINTKLLLSEQD